MFEEKLFQQEHRLNNNRKSYQKYSYVYRLIKIIQNIVLNNVTQWWSHWCDFICCTIKRLIFYLIFNWIFNFLYFHIILQKLYRSIKPQFVGFIYLSNYTNWWSFLTWFPNLLRSSIHSNRSGFNSCGAWNWQSLRPMNSTK